MWNFKCVIDKALMILTLCSVHDMEKMEFNVVAGEARKQSAWLESDLPEHILMLYEYTVRVY